MVDVMDEVPKVTSFEERILIHRSLTSAGSGVEERTRKETNCDEQKRVNANGKSNALSHELGATFMWHSWSAKREILLLPLRLRGATSSFNLEKRRGKLPSFHAIYLLKILARLLCQESRFEREDNDNAVEKIARSNFHFPKKPLAILLTKTFLYRICFNYFNGISILALEKSNFKLYDKKSHEIIRKRE